MSSISESIETLSTPNILNPKRTPMKQHYLLKNANINKIFKEYNLDLSTIKKINKQLDYKIKCRNSNISMNMIENYNQQHQRPKRSRVAFTVDEDEKIKYLVNKYGTHNWQLVSSYLGVRTAKQCRDRYFNYLSSSFNKCEWTKEEDELLEKLYEKIGPKWCIMQKSFPLRNSHSIKNRWNYFLCKKQQKEISNEKKAQNLNEKKEEICFQSDFTYDENKSYDEFDNDDSWFWYL